MRTRDGHADYGWVSIGLHWIGAALVLTMLFVGDSIHAPDPAMRAASLKTHTTLGLGFYLVFWARILWRMKAGHPAALPRQKRLYYVMGKVMHHALLAALAMMLVSGPLMAWSGGLPLRLFELEIPSPLARAAWLFTLTGQLHAVGATVLGWGTLLHVLAVVKHTAVDKDGALDRILVPLEKTERPHQES